LRPAPMKSTDHQNPFMMLKEKLRSHRLRKAKGRPSFVLTDAPHQRR